MARQPSEFRLPSSLPSMWLMNSQPYEAQGPAGTRSTYSRSSLVSRADRRHLPVRGKPGASWRASGNRLSRGRRGAGRSRSHSPRRSGRCRSSRCCALSPIRAGDLLALPCSEVGPVPDLKLPVDGKLPFYLRREIDLFATMPEGVTDRPCSFPARFAPQHNLTSGRYSHLTSAALARGPTGESP